MVINVQRPFHHPCDKSVIPEPAKLSEDQQNKYDKVLEHFTRLEKLPVSSDKKQAASAESSPLTDAEKAWLTKECFLRYLRATKWHSDHAIKRIEATLLWRRTFGVDPDSTLTADLVSVENETGKQVILGFDNDSRPCLHLITGAQNTKASHRQVQHLVFMLERVIDYMPPGQDQLALLIDFKSSKTGGKLPSLSIGREVLSILQDHYPERLGKALLTNIPWLGWTFLKLIHPFIDPLTREKLVFQEPFPNYVPAQQLMTQFGGDVAFEYKHDIYWPDMCEVANSRRKDYMAHFRRLGSKVGLSEVDLRDKYPKDAEAEAQDSQTTAAAAAVGTGADSSTASSATVSNGADEEMSEKLQSLKVEEDEQPATTTVAAAAST